MSSIFDQTTDALAESLNLRQLKHAIVSSNIANAETPGYKAKKIDFEESLAKALFDGGAAQIQTTNSEHIGEPSVTARVDIYDDPDGVVKNDGNSVDLDRQMVEMVENSILYRASLQMINKKLAKLKYVAMNGGGY